MPTTTQRSPQPTNQERNPEGPNHEASQMNQKLIKKLRVFKSGFYPSEESPAAVL